MKRKKRHIIYEIKHR